MEWMEIMAKNILDEILKDDKSDIVSNENEVLSELLNEINLDRKSVV
mgnify:CR=1 FL=1